VKAAYSIRKAIPSDLDALIRFTLQEALEAEGAEKNVEGVRRGVLAAFADPPAATYWMVETREGQVVGSTSSITEWSDYNGGYYWWVQSIFIVPEHRGRGVVDLLLDHLARTAKAAGALDLRLVVHHSNRRALRAYQRCGFAVAPYVIMRKPLS